MRRKIEKKKEKQEKEYQGLRVSQFLRVDEAKNFEHSGDVGGDLVDQIVPRIGGSHVNIGAAGQLREVRHRQWRIKVVAKSCMHLSLRSLEAAKNNKKKNGINISSVCFFLLCAQFLQFFVRISPVLLVRLLEILQESLRTKKKKRKQTNKNKRTK
jgi:hypothetical protein